jgi:hypothetical protein
MTPEPLVVIQAEAAYSSCPTPGSVELIATELVAGDDEISESTRVTLPAQSMWAALSILLRREIVSPSKLLS